MLPPINISIFNFLLIMHDRYTDNLADAREIGIKKGAVSGASLGFLFLIMFATYGLAFWYGSTLILKGEITLGDLLVSFFGVLIGAFSLGQVIFKIVLSTEDILCII